MHTKFNRVLVVLNWAVLLPSALILLSTTFLGPAAVVPALIFVFLAPLVGILLLVDFVMLTVYLLKYHKSSEKIIGGFLAWIVLLVLSGSVGYIAIHRWQDSAKGNQVLSSSAAIKLIQDCSIESFQRTAPGVGPPNTISLTYKDRVVDNARSTQHAANIGWNELVAAARQNSGKCGGVNLVGDDNDPYQSVVIGN